MTDVICKYLPYIVVTPSNATAPSYLFSSCSFELLLFCPVQELAPEPPEEHHALAAGAVPVDSKCAIMVALGDTGFRGPVDSLIKRILRILDIRES